MVLPGHLAGGYLATTALLAIFHPNLSIHQLNILLLLGTCAGEFPDVDLFFFNLKYRHQTADRKDSHRNYITHVPFLWLVICLCIVTLGIVSNSTFTQYVGWIILIGTWSHFILDSIEYGIRWYAPFSNKRVAIKLEAREKPTNDRPGSLMQYFHFLTETYWKTATFWLEILITILALFVFVKSIS